MSASFSGFHKSEEVTFEERQFIRAICEEYARKAAQPVSKHPKNPSPFAQILEGIEKTNSKKI